MTTVHAAHEERVLVEEGLYFIRGERLRERRNALRLKQEEAAARAGVDVSYWSQLENNRARNPGLATLRRVAQAVLTSVSYLIGETDDPRPIVTDSDPMHDGDYWSGGSGVLDPEEVLVLERAFLEVMERRRRRQKQQSDTPNDQ